MKFIASILLLFFSVVLSSGQTQKTEYKIYPVDETGKDSSLVVFVAQLKTILYEKDTASLFALMHPKIVTSFGGVMFGKQDFIMEWHLDKPDSSEVWDLMLKVINLGGVFCNGIFDEDSIDAAFCYPYTSDSRLYESAASKMTDLFFDPYFTGVCVSINAPVYESCNTKSKQIASISFDILQIDYEKTQTAQPDAGLYFEMHYINTLDGTVKGWINASEICALGGRTLNLEKSDGKWLITGFVAFD